jgi:hypothetical protein
MDLIPALSRLAAEQLARQFGIPVTEVTADMIELLATGVYGPVRTATEMAYHAVTSYNEAERIGVHPAGASESNSPSEEHSMSAEQRLTGDKRKRHEEHGMEPTGHGNTPATGTERQAYIERYLPVNFPDKFTIKSRWSNSYTIRNAATSNTAATYSGIVWNTNDPHDMESTVSGAISGTFHPLTLTKPNQFNGTWSAIWTYYRVESLDYKIHVSNIGMGTGQTQTAAPAFTGPGACNDAIVTLLKTQNATDIIDTQQNATWQQKQAHNVYLQSRTPGALKTYHCFEGSINPEDYDIDPMQTAQDETWTAVGSNPVPDRYLALAVYPASQYTTASLLPEAIVQVFCDFTVTIQLAGYNASTRQTAG